MTERANQHQTEYKSR